MKRLFVLSIILLSSFSFAGELDTVKWDGNAGTTDWHTSGNWLRFGTQEGWSLGRAVPESWQRAYIGKDMPSGSNVVVDINGGAAATEVFYVGLNTDAVNSVTVNLASGVSWSNSGYVLAQAQSKATFNVDGTLTIRMADFNGATINIGDGGYMRIYTNWWYLRTGTKVNVAEGGIMSFSLDSGYGATGRGAGAINLEGGVVRLDGDKTALAESYISSGFVIAYEGNSNYTLEVSYDGSHTYITVVGGVNLYENFFTAAGDGSSWADAANWQWGIPVYNTDNSQAAYLGLNATGNIEVDVITRAVAGYIYQGRAEDDFSSTMNVNTGGEVYNVYYYLGSKGTININGGFLNPFGTRQIDGTININSGTYQNRSFVWRIGGLVVINQGTFTIGNGTRFSESSTDITAPNGHFTGTIDIRGGIMRMQGDCRTAINWHINNGNIIAYGGDEDAKLDVEYNPETNRTIVSARANWKKAYLPSPAVGAIDCALDSSLSWRVDPLVSQSRLYIAKEYISDLNDDGFVDLDDFKKFAGYWLEDTGEAVAAADINDDFDVDLGDFSVMAEQWNAATVLEQVAVFNHTSGGENDPAEPINYIPQQNWKPDAAYLWRVDTVIDENTTEGDVWRFNTLGSDERNIAWLLRYYPEFIDDIFNNFDLTNPALSEVSEAVDKGNMGKACKLILDYYADSSSGSWIRGTSVAEATAADIEYSDFVLQDIYTHQNATGQIPRTASGAIDWSWFGPENDPEWGWVHNRLQYFLILEKAYNTTGNIAYINRINEEIQDWVLNCPYSPTTKNPQWRGLEVAIRAGVFMDTFYRLYDDENFSDVSKLLILSTLRNHAQFLLDNHQSGGNWLLTEMRGVATVGGGWPEIKNSASYLNYAYDKVLPQISVQVYPDGAYKELTSNYHNIALKEFNNLAILGLNSGQDIDESYFDLVESMWNYSAMTLLPTGFTPNNSDSGLRYYAPDVIDASYSYGRPDWRYVATNGAEGSAPAGEASVYFPWAGQLVSRSGWDADAHWSFFDIGPYGTSGGHIHYDKLHFSAAAYGRYILVDSGIAPYYGDLAAIYRAYSIGTSAHNVVTIAGENQLLGSYVSNSSPQTDDCIITPTYDFAKGTVNTGYSNTTGVAENTRLVRYERGKYWVIVDKFTTDRTRSIETIWHYHPDCNVITDGLEVTSNDAGLGNIRVVPLGSMSWNLDIISGQLDPVQGWYFESYGLYEPNPTAVYSADINAGDNVFAWIIIPGLGTPAQMSGEILSSTQSSITIKVIEAPGVENIITLDY